MNIPELSKAIFDLAARLLGLFLFYQGVRVLGIRILDTWFIAAVHFAGAFFLASGRAMRWAYPEPKAPKAKVPDAGAAPTQKADEPF